MKNLSQAKRLKMLEFLDRIRAEHSDNDSIIAINEIANELTEKKYGLVWEKHNEKVDNDIKLYVPVFKEILEREIKALDSEDVNFLLEGDNLHSLKLLERTHKGAIDCIYIDPPYNTGKEDFRYDDNFIDSNDTYKHSKWLSFMAERLTIAQRLLSSHGLIFISIDDKEASQLRLLCDEIFNDINYQNTLYIQVRYADKTLTQDMDYHKQVEQVLVYGKTEHSKPYRRPLDYDYNKFIYSFEEFSSGTEIELGGKKVIMFQKGEYKIVKHKEGYKEGLKEIWATGSILNGNSSGRFFRDYLTGRKNIDGLGVMYKVYDIGDDQFDYRYFTGPQKSTATKGKYFQGVPTDKLNEGSSKTVPIPNFYDMAGDFGNISKEGGVDFNSGKKPVKLINMFLDFFERKNITVLDFFAGSASTGHAVLKRNAEDNGTRKFILCTDNAVKDSARNGYLLKNGYVKHKKEIEYFIKTDSFKEIQDTEEYQQLGIARGVAYHRLKNVIEGYGNYAGLKSNLKYYKTEMIPKTSDDINYSVSKALIHHIKEMVQLENGTIIDNNNYILILSPDDMEELEDHPERLENCKAVYLSVRVLLTTQQKRLLSKVKIIGVPDYYFESDLQEVGER